MEDIRLGGTSTVQVRAVGRAWTSAQWGPPMSISVGDVLEPTSAIALWLQFADVTTSFSDGSGVGLSNGQTGRFSYRWNLDAEATPVA
ncbi:MAG: hypothetical protein FD127_4442, partial [Acidimicrobiaceae bacterium]